MKQKAVLSVILAGILWGIISFFIKGLSAAGFDSMQISCVRMITASVIFTVIIAIISPEKLKVKIKNLPVFIGTGIVSIVLFNCCYFYTIIKSQASVAVVLLYTSPVFVMILSAVIFKERITVKKIIALILTLCGSICVAGLLGGGYRITPIVLLTGLGSGLFYALYTIFGRFALEKYDTVTVTVYTFIFAALGSLPIGKLNKTVEIITSNPKIILYCIGVGIICTVLPYFLYTWGLQRMESGKAAIFVAVEPVVGAVVGMTFYNEPYNFLKILGMVFIVGSIILLGFSDSIKSKKGR